MFILFIQLSFLRKSTTDSESDRALPPDVTVLGPRGVRCVFLTISEAIVLFSIVSSLKQKSKKIY
jgi:hypothetical protein